MKLYLIEFQCILSTYYNERFAGLTVGYFRQKLFKILHRYDLKNLGEIDCILIARAQAQKEILKVKISKMENEINE